MVDRYLILLFCLVPLATPTSVNAQGVPHFIEKLTTAEGLSSNNINDLAQDNNGFLWIATPDGLNRYDGTEVTQYFHHSGSNSIPHNYVYCLKKLPGGSLAIGTASGLAFYDTHTGIFQQFYHRLNTQMDEYNNTILQLETDVFGNCWAASQNCVYLFDLHHRLKKVFCSPFTGEDASRQRVRYADKILPLSNGDAWLHLYNGWRMYDHKKDTLSTDPFFLKDDALFPEAHIFPVYDKYLFYICPHTDSLQLLDERGHRLSSWPFPYNKYPHISWSQTVTVLDSSRMLLLLHNYGMIIINIDWREGLPYFYSMTPLVFPASEYNTALRDVQGNWWLATTREGLQKISPSRQHFHGETLIDRTSGQPARYEATTISHSGTHLWIGTYGNGFFEKDLRNDSIRQYLLTHTGDDTWANFVWNIRQINEDTLWLGTQTGLFWYCLRTKKSGRLPGSPDKPPALDSVAITTQFYDGKEFVWMGMGKGKGLCRWDLEQRRFHYYPGNDPHAYPLRYPTHISDDGQDGLWFVSDASTKLVHWSRRTDSFQVVSLPASLRDQLGDLSCIYCDNDSILWLGSIASGLVRYNCRNESAILYGHEKGLANSHIGSIYNDHHGKLWLTTEGGLTCFYLSTETFVNYSTRDGLPVTYPTADFYFDTSNRRLYSGGHGSLFYFFPHLICPSPTPLKTLITGLKVDGNNVTVQYTAIDLTDGAGTCYAYQLQGMDTGWIMAGHQRQISFGHLGPGSYTFMVHAAGAGGERFGQTASVSFRIPTPFLRTPVFFMFMALVLGGMVYALYAYRQNQLNHTRQIRSEISRNLHDEVGANLTNISLSSLRAKQQLHNEKAVSQLLESIYEDSQTVSEAMRDIIWSIDPAIDTLGDALPRMLHYATRLLEADKIELHAEIPVAVEDIKLSMKQRRDVYLIFKEGVNNMAKHSNATQASIHFASAPNTLIMTIADNGCGFDAGAIRMSNGLRNMRERARDHGWQLKIESGPKAGTTIILHACIA